MRTFNLFICLVLSLGLGLCGCDRAGGRHADNLRASARDVSEVAEHIRKLESGTLEKTEEIYKSAKEINTLALELIDTIPADSPAASSVASIGEASVNILEDRQIISDNAHAVLKDATILKAVTKDIEKDAKRVQDAPSFWSGIAFWLKAIVLTTVAVLLTAVCWRFGLDQLVRVIATTIAGWITWLGKRIHTRLDGPVKLLGEAAQGKIPLNEALAALREASPEVDRLFREKKNE